MFAWFLSGDLSAITYAQTDDESTSKPVLGQQSGGASGASSDLNPPTGLSPVANDEDIIVTFVPSEAPHFYQFEVSQSASEDGTYTSFRSEGATESPMVFGDLEREQWYKVRGRNCLTRHGTGCGQWSEWSDAVELGYDPPPQQGQQSGGASGASSDLNPPTGLSPVANDEDIIVTFVPSEAPHFYQFEVSQSAGEEGTYTSLRSEGATESPMAFGDLEREQWYKVRGRNCLTRHGTGCGQWSEWSDAVELALNQPDATGSQGSTNSPDPPTDLGIRATNRNIWVDYTRSESPHYYEFELHRSTTEDGTYSKIDTDEDSFPPALFSGVSKGYWYKAMGRNCATSSRTGCGDWSDFTSVIYLEPDPPTDLSISATDDDITVTYTRSESPHKYEFELHRSTTRSGTYSRVSTDEDTNSPVFFNNWNKGYWYKARGRNCGAGSTSTKRIDCGDWSDFTSVIYLEPDPPTNLSISASNDDIRVTYTRSESPHRYEFELRRSTTEDGTYSQTSTDEDTHSPAYFSNEDKGYWYKARGRNCGAGSTSTKRIDCGDWSDFTSVIYLEPDPPTDLGISATDDDVRVTFTQSESPHKYEFELHRSTTRSGTYSETSTDEVTDSPVDFNNENKGYWYKARGRNCGAGSTSSRRIDCGDWSDFTSVIYLEPDPPTDLGIGFNGDDVRVTYTRSESPHKYEFELHRSTTRNGTYSETATEEDSSPPVEFNDQDKKYWYKARGRNCGAGSTSSRRIDCGDWSDFSSPRYFTPDPPKPTGLTATADVDDGEIDITWDRMDEISKFWLQRKLGSSGTWTTVNNNILGSSEAIMDDDVECGEDEDYFYRLAAFGDGETYDEEWGDWSDTDSASLACPDPPKPTGFSATADVDDGEIDLTWDRMDDISKFWLQRKLGSSGTWTTVNNNILGSSEAIMDDDVECGEDEDYFYRLAAFGDGETYDEDWGDWSDTDSESLPCPDRPGSVNLSSTLPQVGMEIIATLSDPDGGETNQSWQWQSNTDRQPDGTFEWEDIDEAESHKYTPDAGDVGFQLRVRVSYSDDHGSGKSATSDATSAVSAPTLDPPQNLRSTTGDGKIKLEWDTVTNADGYVVQQQVSGKTSWTAVDDADDSDTMVTVTGLTNTKSYKYRVKSKTDSGFQDSNWATSPSIGLPLAAPTNLDVIPLPRRQARLSWTYPNHNPSGTSYQVKIQPNTAHPATMRMVTVATPATKLVIDLDNVMGSTTPKGLGDDPYSYEILIQAQSRVGLTPVTQDSETITMEDSPIISINGDSRARSDGKGEVLVKWDKPKGVTVTGYTLRWRKLGSDMNTNNHTNYYWELDDSSYPDTYDDTDSGTVDIDKSLTQWKIPSISSIGEDTPLKLEEIYAIQLNYTTASGKVFSTRDRFVWPSSRAAGNGERVASFPLNYPVAKKTYNYHICEDTFPTAKIVEWRNLINSALSQWQKATGDLVKMKFESTASGESRPCANYIANVPKALVVVRRLLENKPSLPNDELKKLITAELLRLYRWTDFIEDDRMRNEVIMVDNTSASFDAVKDHAIFPEIAESIGLAECGFKSGGCALPRHKYPKNGENINITDILLPKSVYENETLAIPNVQFNDKCVVGGVYGALVHEAGHALGIRDSGTPVPDVAKHLFHHSNVPGSVMNYDGDVPPVGTLEEPDCSPHPLDVLAIYAIYQTD